MRVVRTFEDLPCECVSSVFLAGPTPRRPEVPSWRPLALAALAARGFSGVAYVPEPLVRRSDPSAYADQVDWETRALRAADVVMFWVPRDLRDMPAFTTNCEWGHWRTSGKAVLGVPEGAQKCGYLLHQARLDGVPVSRTLEDTVDNALSMIRVWSSSQSRREGAVALVPLCVSSSPEFGRWLRAQTSAGNELVSAEVAWCWWGRHLGVPKEGERRWPFFFALRASVRVGSEGGRIKSNGLMISRPDVAAVVCWHRAHGSSVDETSVVLVREFRTCATTPDAHVWELPSGSAPASSWDSAPVAVAREELAEEAGLRIPESRLVPHGTRQLCGTTTSHSAHLFSVQLTDPELDSVRLLESSGQPLGVCGDTERTFVNVCLLREIKAIQTLNPSVCVDWSTLGMILSVLT